MTFFTCMKVSSESVLEHQALCWLERRPSFAAVLGRLSPDDENELSGNEITRNPQDKQPVSVRIKWMVPKSIYFQMCNNYTTQKWQNNERFYLIHIYVILHVHIYFLISFWEYVFVIDHFTAQVINLTPLHLSCYVNPIDLHTKLYNSFCT